MWSEVVANHELMAVYRSLDDDDQAELLSMVEAAAAEQATVQASALDQAGALLPGSRRFDGDAGGTPPR